MLLELFMVSVLHHIAHLLFGSLASRWPASRGAHRVLMSPRVFGRAARQLMLWRTFSTRASAKAIVNGVGACTSSPWPTRVRDPTGRVPPVRRSRDRHSPR